MKLDQLEQIGVGYTIATGRLFCSMVTFQETCEWLLDRPLMTHDFADPVLWAELRDSLENAVLEASA